MHTEIPKTYTAKDWEEKLYARWEESGLFNPDTSASQERYCNILPPPNANGELHVGHASGYTVMDIFGRFERMRGKQVLLLPGKDHAGIQTQVVFEKKLQAQGLDRHALGREKFYQATYEFCLDRAQYMRSQEKRIGLSADWSREKFTLDPEVSKRATATFVEMYQDGMIYRGERIINWCPRCATALSDIEVIHEETAGKLYYITYPVKDSSEKIVVATTRPETMLGDTAVAVHPFDTRYQSLVGKTLIIPLINREIPIIADERIDQNFGTGAVKITPAHDPLDWEIGTTHHLPVLHVISTEAKITEVGQQFQGLSVSEARTKVLEALAAAGNLEREEDHTINLSSCERCKTSIEPLVSKQWFVNVDAPQYSLKKKSIAALETEAIVFHPENMKSQMIHWLDNLHDWCISRQIWWGHRIPVWYCAQTNDTCKEPIVSLETISACPHCAGPVTQDPDTLDTWFSSGQWPYTTLGYPETEDAQRFYPTDTMVMGRDLLFFWATRMIMFGVYKTHTVPFQHLYFTGLARDKEGHKMSKSKGNASDVLEMIERFGADAVRLSVTLGTTPGLDFRLYEEKIESFRNFANKLWNIGRYVANNQNSDDAASLKPKSNADLWILKRTEDTVREVTRLLENRLPSLAGETLRDFTWNEFADWYVEIHKAEKNDTVLCSVFETLLKLWHPFMPFVTEALYQHRISGRSDAEPFLMIARWPEDILTAMTEEESKQAEQFQLVIGLIQEIRALRNLYKISPAQHIVVIVTKGAHEMTLSRDNGDLFKRLARISEIRVVETIPEKKILVQSGLLQAFIDLEGVIDTDAERARIDKEKGEKMKYISALEMKLGNQNFVERAKPEIVAAERAKLEEAKKQLTDLEQQLASLS